MTDKRYFHVTSSLNRESIRDNGLDWDRMGDARGIAGSRSPEQAGCFVCEDDQIEWFVLMNNTGGPVDVWEVTGVDRDELQESPEGFFYVPRRISPADIELVRRDIAPLPRPGRSGSEQEIRRPRSRSVGHSFEL